jgi:hypothetical protein
MAQSRLLRFALTVVCSTTKSKHVYRARQAKKLSWERPVISEPASTDDAGSTVRRSNPTPPHPFAYGEERSMRNSAVPPSQAFVG